MNIMCRLVCDQMFFLLVTPSFSYLLSISLLNSKKQRFSGPVSVNFPTPQTRYSKALHNNGTTVHFHACYRS